MNGPQIVLFADGGPSVGTGHIFRQYPIFCCLQAMGISAEMWVPLAQESLNNLGVRGVQSAPEEPQTIALILSSFAPSVVVLDTYRHLSEITELLEFTNCKLAIFDDHFRVKRKVALIVNSSPAENAGDYDPDLATQFLIGPEYASISKSFLAARQSHRVSGDISNVLVALGGSDFGQNLPLLLGATMPLLQSSTRICVLGGHPISMDVPGNIKLTWGWLDQDILAQRMPDFDLAILAGGTMLWQAACVGIPTLSWPQTPGQEAHAAAWQKKGVVVAIKSLDAMPATLEQLQSVTVRQELSIAGRTLIDGLGATRIASCLSEMLKR